MTNTYKVQPSRLDTLVAKLTKLAKRATKLGVTAPSWTIGALESKKVRESDLSLDAKLIVWYPVTLTSEPVKLAGFTFIATLDHASEAGVVLRTVPGETLPTSYREALPVCDHCGTARARKETFIVRAEDGALKQVGRSCLKDFMGVDPEKAAKLAEWVIEIGECLQDEERWGSSESRDYVGIETFLTWVAAFIRVDGWVSRKTAKEQEGRLVATADAAVDAYFTRSDDKKAKYLPERTEADSNRAAEALVWGRELRANSTKELNDYEHNLVVAVAGAAVSLKNAGIAASLIPAWDRFQGREIEHKRRNAASANSVHFGTIGKRAVFNLTVIAFSDFDSDYGTRRLVRFLDEVGNVATWWTSPSAAGDFEVGTHATVKATVKEHGDYKGTKQTVLSRAALVAEIKEEVAVPA